MDDIVSKAYQSRRWEPRKVKFSIFLDFTRSRTDGNLGIMPELTHSKPDNESRRAQDRALNPAPARRRFSIKRFLGTTQGALLMTDKPTRRRFIQTSAAAVTALSASKIHGANERIRAGFIGVGNRGGQLLEATLPNEDVEVVALCDVYRPYLDKWTEKFGGATTHRDFREVIGRDDIDAANEKIIGNDAANALLHYNYREPWKLA